MNTSTKKNYSIYSRNFIYNAHVNDTIKLDYSDKWSESDNLRYFDNFICDYESIDHSPTRSSYEVAKPMLIELKYAWYKEALIYERLFVNHSYKETKDDNFTQFCEWELGLPLWRVRDKINAASCVTDLLGLGFTDLPLTENIAKVLFKVKEHYYKQVQPVTDYNDAESLELIDQYLFDLRDIWESFLIVDPCKRTEKRLKDLIKLAYPNIFPKPKKRPVTLKTETVELIENVVTDINVNPNELITMAIDNYLKNGIDNHHSVYDDPIDNSDFDIENECKELTTERTLLDRFKKICLENEVDYVEMLTKILTNDSYIMDKINHYLMIKSLEDKTGKKIGTHYQFTLDDCLE